MQILWYYTLVIFSSLIGHEYYRKNYDDLILIGEDALEPIEWEENGVDIQCEFGEASDGRYLYMIF